MASSIAPRVVRLTQLAAYVVAMVALAVVAWRCTSLSLPNVGQFAGIVGSGFLGGIINPVRTAAGAAKQAEQDGSEIAAGKHDLLWNLAAIIGAGTVIAGALALAVHGERHVNAAAALTALATAFGALFFDTSGITHTLGTVAAAAKND
jgi:hypothetical protein